jgi:hypothetical protein
MRNLRAPTSIARACRGARRPLGALVENAPLEAERAADISQSARSVELSGAIHAFMAEHMKGGMR